jgi:hypothetical protein
MSFNHFALRNWFAFLAIIFRLNLDRTRFDDEKWSVDSEERESGLISCAFVVQKRFA